MSLQIGIIGAGGVARPHLTGFMRVPDVERIVVADPDEAARQDKKGLFPQIETTADYREILSDPEIAIVDICLPHHLHRAVVVEALEAGKDVFCEKPIATRLEDAIEMVTTADRLGRKFYVSLNQMFTPAHRKAKELIVQGALGKVLMGVWKMMGDEFARMNAREHWKGDIGKAGGGALFDTGMHAAYVLLDLFGPARQVSAFARRLLVEPDNKGDDNSVAIIEFESGAVVTYAQSYTVRSEPWNERKYVYGSEGSLHIDDTSIDEPLILYSNATRAGTPVPVEPLPSLWAETVARSVRHHMDCYVNDKAPLYDTTLAVDALRLILALYRSSDTGRTVALDEVNGAGHGGDKPVDVAELREDPTTGFAPLPMKFGGGVGLVVHFNQGETMDHLEDLKALGVKWVRDEESWAGVERKKGEYVWPEKRMRRLEFYRDNGIKVIFALTYGAHPDANPEDPYNPGAFGGYAVEAVRLHKEAGVEIVLEIFNEPHNFGLLENYGGKWHGAPPCPWIDHYLKMASEAVKQVKAYDPTIELITDEDVWTCHYWYLEGGLPKALDGFAVHPYVNGGGSPGPEVAHFPPGEGWHKPWTIIDEDRSNRSLMRRLRAQYAEKLGHRAEMYITEWGYNVGRVGWKGEEVTEELAAAFLPRLYINGVAAGARVVCWHCSQDMGDGPYGLIRNDQTRRKTYDTFRSMVDQLGEYRMVSQLAGLLDTTRGIQAYLFEGDAGYKLVAWSIDGPVEAAFESGTSAPLRIYDHFGKSLPIQFAKDGPPILKLDRAPIYIEGISEACSIGE